MRKRTLLAVGALLLAILVAGAVGVKLMLDSLGASLF